MSEAAQLGERPVLQVVRRDLRPVVLGLVGGGVALVLVDLIAPWHSLSPLTMLAMLLWFGAAGILVAQPAVVVRAGAAGIRVGPHEPVPWSAVHAVVLVRRDVLRFPGSETAVFLVLASAPVTDMHPLPTVLDEDPRVVLAHALPAAVAELDAAELAVRLQIVQPAVVVVDHRG